MNTVLFIWQRSQMQRESVTKQWTDDAAVPHVIFNWRRFNMTAPKHGCLFLLNACCLDSSLLMSLSHLFRSHLWWKAQRREERRRGQELRIYKLSDEKRLYTVPARTTWLASDFKVECFLASVTFPAVNLLILESINYTYRMSCIQHVNVTLSKNCHLNQCWLIIWHIGCLTESDNSDSCKFRDVKLIVRTCHSVCLQPSKMSGDKVYKLGFGLQ